MPNKFAPSRKMLITPEYQALQQKFHEDRPDYGTSSPRHVEFILDIAKKMNTRSILDYGCGKAGLQKGIPFPITNYDPCMPEYAKRPEGKYDIVVCTDVLEHIEHECLIEVVADLAALTEQVLFLNVATRPAGKFLPDGRNAHLIQESASWWLRERLLYSFDLTSFQVGKGEFTCILVPPQQAATE